MLASRAALTLGRAAASHALARRLSTGVEAKPAWMVNLSGSKRYDGARGPWWFTGPTPRAAPGFDARTGALAALPLLNTATASRDELLANFDNTWALTETLMAGLNGEAAFFRPPYHGLRHPMVFYYAHPAALFINKMRVAGLLPAAVNADFERVFETGVDEMSWDDMSKATMRWPSLDAVLDYRARCYELISNVIRRSPEFDSLAERGMDSPFWSVVMGIDHERIHLETSSVLIRELPLRLVQRPDGWAPVHPSATAPSAAAPEPGRDYPVNDMIAVPAGRVTLGKPREWPSFGWDLEYGRLERDVPAFAASRFKVSNGEMREFVADGGYLQQKWWSPSGWAWRSFRNIKWPTFWVQDGPAGLHAYKLRTVFDEVSMPWAWPAEVNFYEAEAFARWASAKHARPLRVSTELEAVRTRDADPGTIGAAKNVAADHAMAPDSGASRFNLALRFSSASPVNAYPPNTKGFHDTFGNVWEWCEDQVAPLDGFAVHEYYPDFSLPCFDGKHQVITGGAFASAGDEASVFSRFHFRPHFFQHAGFRLVDGHGQPPLTSCTDSKGPFVGVCNPYRVSARVDAATATAAAAKATATANAAALTGNLKYDELSVLQQYLHMHYSAHKDPRVPPPLVPATAFAQRCARTILDARELTRTARALDIGCAVGASSFELARTFRSVHGLDISATFIAAANALRLSGAMPYELLREGAVFDTLTAQVDPAVDRTRVSFAVGDATKLDPVALGGAFDAVLIGNVLCRLPDPRLLLDVLPALVAPGGLLFISSPFSWLERFTPRALWLGSQNGAAPSSANALLARLERDFALVSQADAPFAIREHGRKFEYVVAHTAMWKRRA